MISKLEAVGLGLLIGVVAGLYLTATAAGELWGAL